MRISYWSSDVCSSDLVELGVGQVEVQPPLVGADLPARHVAGHHGAEQVQAGVHAHVAVAAVPVELRRPPRAGGGRRGAFLPPVDPVLLAVALPRVDTPQRRPVRPYPPPPVPPLAATGGEPFRGKGC